MTLFGFLQQPYPHSESVAASARRAGLIGAFVGTFLLLFQPFDLDDWQTTWKALKIGGFGFVTFSVLLFHSVLMPRLFPRYFSEARWTVGTEILFILTHILLIAVANRLYLSWLLDYPLSGGWGWMLGITFLVSIFPTVGVVITNYITQLRRYSRQADVLSGQMVTSSASSATEAMAPTLAAPAQLTLTADNEKDTLTLAATDLLAIESSDNYCTVFFWKAGRVAKELMRSSLSRLETQLSEQWAGDSDDALVRCHRSYVVNLIAVERVSGNAQGYKLHLAGGQVVVPVARKYNDTLVKRLKG